MLPAYELVGPSLFNGFQSDLPPSLSSRYDEKVDNTLWHHNIE